MDNKEALLQKIKALAERGVDGEKESAQQILSRLMEKYGLTEADIETERIETAWFRYHDDFERRILNQIIYMVTGKVSCGCVGAQSERPRKQRGVDCTAAEKLEIEANYGFFLAAAKEELEFFYRAFAVTNHLYPPEEKNTLKSGDDKELTPEEKRKAFRAGLMAEGMERRTLKKALTGGMGQ